MHDICACFSTIKQLFWWKIIANSFVVNLSYIYISMVSHDTFKNIILFSLVVAFLYFLFRDKINIVTEESFSVPDNAKVSVLEKKQSGHLGAMTAANTGIDRALIKSDDEIGILSTCEQNSEGDLVKHCSEIQAYNYQYDTAFDKFLRPTSFDQPTYLKSAGI